MVNPNYYRSSGVTVALSRLGDALAASGVSVQFADCRHGSGVETDLEGWKSGVVATFRLMSKSPFTVIAAMLRLRSFLRAQAVDVVHLHHRRLALLVGLVARTLQIPVIYTGHLTYGKSVLFRRSPLSAMVAISESVMANLQMTHPCRKRFLISNVVEFPEQPAATPGFDPRQVCCVARLEPVKNHPTLLRAWALLDPVRRGLKLLLVGEGGEMRSLEILASQLGIESSIEFLGYRSDVREIVASSLFCVLPSFREGQGLVTIEAASVGRASLVTDVDGSRDCVPPQATLPNRIDAYSDSALASAMSLWLGSPESVIHEGEIFRNHWKTRAAPAVVAQATIKAYVSVGAPEKC